MSIKSDYFKMNKDDFNNYLTSIKNNSNTIKLLNGKYFFYNTIEINNKIIKLHKDIQSFDNIINSFSTFSKRQIIQSFLIDEIQSTNSIENIYSTKHDIFYLINNINNKDNKIKSISLSYKYLLETKGINITTLKDIRDLYDYVLKDCIDKSDIPDGVHFRKKEVYITDGIDLIHSGLIGEDNINEAMNEFIKLYNSNLDIITKMILSHFMFEFIHPFYDGNGRLGRYLFSNGLYKELNTIYSFVISYSLENEKNKYYKAFKEARDKYSLGCLNDYFETILDILLNELDIIIKELNEKKNIINYYLNRYDLSKSENKIYKLLIEGSILTNFGICYNEIMEECNISKRTLIYSMNDLKNMHNIITTKIGRITYYKIELK
jgi:Fic family protein